MASIMYVKSKNRWRVRKHITDRTTGSIRKFDVLVPSKTQASTAAAEFDRIARSVKSGASSPDQVVDAVRYWLEYMQTRTARTHDLYTRNINKFTASLPHHVYYIHQIQPCHIYAFIGSITAQWTAATANRYLTAIKSFCRWCSRKYGIANPSAAVDMFPEPDPESRFLSQAEFDTILSAASKPHADLFLFIAHTGLRASEFCGLTWSSISENGESLTVLGKGRKKRVIPLNQTCRQIIDSHRSADLNPSTPIFMSKSNCILYRGRPMTRGGLYNICREYSTRLKLASFGPHAFRHWFATRLLLAGVPIAHVSLLLGHSSIITTQRHYIHILPSHLRGITDCLVTQR